MKTLFSYLVLVGLIWYLFNSGSGHVVPDMDDLESVDGSVVSVEELAGRRGLKNGHLLVTVHKDGWKRQLVSYDKSLTTLIRPGAALEAKVYDGTGDSELWVLNTSDGVRRSLQDTTLVRAADLRRQRITSFVVALVLAAIGLTHLRKIFRQED
jgi:hypothetical protein